MSTGNSGADRVMDHSSAILQRLLALHPRKIDLSLGRIERLLAALGHPERRLAPVLHVAGTNGKGSTIAFLRAMLEAAGRRVHVYTSPHLVRFHERFRLAREGGGDFVSDERLADVLRHCERVNDGQPITVFEMATVAAFQLFAAEPADYVVLETGLGGRFDATNVIDRPEASVITSISRDHTAYLGDDVRMIAGEKAGIIKPGRPVVIAVQSDEIRAVLAERAARCDAPVIAAGSDFSAHEERGRLVYQDTAGLLDLPLPKLVGRHQIDNAATAIATLRVVADAAIDDDAIATGLQTVDWPGRLQRLTGRLTSFVPPAAEIWLDGGHNADGGRALAAAMADLEERVPRPLVLVVGMLKAKSAAGFLTPFGGLVEEVATVPILDNENGFPPEDLADIARQIGLAAAPRPTLITALEHLSTLHDRIPPRILICGSLHLAGEALALDETLPE